MKFKSGDKVVRIKHCDSPEVVIGDTYIVESQKYEPMVGTEVLILKDIESYFNPEMFVHESVYNSPLYKALNEKE